MYDTTAADVDALFADLSNNNQKRLLLYFHGGLVKTSAGMEIAERVLRYTNTKQANVHPVCFVWEPV
ncbi:hypothetical protein [Chitinophaga pinensis]|uniref:Uncharacterized protein n=1 Tax=Chitinophaga pinensis TaxID=79329 RepID=A0A5C6LKR7_9BACT|nr:hypothetical protein [Chitinophaga pinensis]TWV93267.1 hypothetical protein FEF09_27310 [Chitinophaga pinensis]